jgi:hypothetical protein
MIRDAQGHALSGATAEAVGHHDQAVRAFNLGCGNAIGLFQAAIEAAPDFVLAHIGRAWLFALATDPGALAMARTLADAVRGLTMNPREASLFAALDMTIQGTPLRATLALDRHLFDHPHDILAQEAGFLLDLFLGRTRALRDRPARALPLWASDMPGYGALRAFHAFGLEESGDYARAEDEARQAAVIDPLGFWPHHTVSHVMEMQGRPHDGLAWMREREALWATPEHVTQAHIWWHRALFHIELGETGEALDLLDGPIGATQLPLGVSLTNAAALLWRLSLLGCDVSGRWAPLVAIWQGHADGKCSVFCDLHALMAELGAGDGSAVERRLTWMRTTAASGLEAAACYRTVGLPLAEGLTAFSRGAYEQAAWHLHPVRLETVAIGGSHAQRDIMDLTLTEAALRGGLRDMAIGLAHERLALRPHSRVNQAFLQRAEGLAR